MLKIVEIRCLLKVYLEDGNKDRKLIAEDIALISKEDNGVKIRNLNFEEETLEDVDIVMIDALNSVLLLRKR